MTAAAIDRRPPMPPAASEFAPRRIEEARTGRGRTQAKAKQSRHARACLDMENKLSPYLETNCHDWKVTAKHGNLHLVSI